MSLEDQKWIDKHREMRAAEAPKRAISLAEQVERAEALQGEGFARKATKLPFSPEDVRFGITAEPQDIAALQMKRALDVERRAFWRDVFLEVEWSGAPVNMVEKVAENAALFADAALAEFDKRFK